MLGKKLLRFDGAQSGGCGRKGEADAGIETNVELSRLLLVGVGGCGDGDEDVWKLGLIRENCGSDEGSCGSDGGAAVHDVGESTDSRIAAGSLGGAALPGSGRLVAGHCGC